MECLPSVLIIDENAARASIIEEGLRAAGHDQVTVIDTVTGIAARIASIEPDVIVIDLENPNRDMLESVFQLTRAVKLGNGVAEIGFDEPVLIGVGSVFSTLQSAGNSLDEQTLFEPPLKHFA